MEGLTCGAFFFSFRDELLWVEGLIDRLVFFFERDRSTSSLLWGRAMETCACLLSSMCTLAVGHSPHKTCLCYCSQLPWFFSVHAAWRNDRGGHFINSLIKSLFTWLRIITPRSEPAKSRAPCKISKMGLSQYEKNN
jgi:hypothetical protein